MNHLKDHIKATSTSRHFLTYADNYAVGYFKKQVSIPTCCFSYILIFFKKNKGFYQGN